MDLKTGKMLWLETYQDPPSYPSLQENISCDVVVFGGGEAGALCSHYLAEQGLNTVIVEKRKVGQGSTCANTGLLQFSNDMPLHQMIQVHGEEKAVRFYQLCAIAVNDLAAINTSMAEPVEFARRNSLYYASKPSDVSMLNKEYEAFLKYGFSARWLSKAQIRDQYGFEKEAGLITEGDAEINPYRLAHALIQNSVKNNRLRVYEDTEVTSFHFSGPVPVFRTTQGSVIQAKKAVFCTGYEMQEYEKTPGAVLSSSYALATEAVTDFGPWDRSLIWETARPYLYLRTTADNRVIAGGLDIREPQGAKRDELIFQRTEELREQIVKLFPILEGVPIAYRWAATFGSSQDGLPFVGEHPDYPNCYLNLGYGGNGMVYYVIAAKLLRDMILEQTSPDAAILQPDRLRWDRKLVHKLEQFLI